MWRPENWEVDLEHLNRGCLVDEPEAFEAGADAMMKAVIGELEKMAERERTPDALGGDSLPDLCSAWADAWQYAAKHFRGEE